MSDFYIGQGDTASVLADVLRDDAGGAVNIAGATIASKIVPLRGGAALVDGPAENDQNGDGSDGSLGNVSRAWLPGETDDPGDYLGQWIATYAGGEIQTFPNTGFLLITITPDAPTSAGRYLTLEELKKTLKLEKTNHTDRELEIAIAASAASLETVYNKGRPWTLGAPGEARYFTPAHSKTVIDLRQVIDVDAVELDEAGGGTFSKTLVAGTDYQLERDGSLAVSPPWDALRLLRSGFAYHAEYDPVVRPYPWGVDSLRITGQWGWTETPPGVKVAATIVATRFFRRTREAPFGVVGLGIEGAVVRAASIARDPEIVFAMAEPRALRRHVV